jgi:hypothetical protein
MNHPEFLQAAIDSYKHTYEAGDNEDINFMKRLWGKSFAHPLKITEAVFHEDGMTIDVRFKHQDHVAMYYIIDNKVSFQGFES